MRFAAGRNAGVPRNARSRTDPEQTVTVGDEGHLCLPKARRTCSRAHGVRNALRPIAT
ncbi:hypothetical protein K461DRAFT_275845 [Myriangium duriaei CBS 260.36]|uniref:Uncharacterized protein n=1 Tax=Myriangium duriaei CBS 260.36 TaxID=1168546 RepID=A0A9P4J4J5_9PEZI|nr:hypothetical protein K461DRAFT_275845 [Myriangium duriaei CBS 260.36]